MKKYLIAIGYTLISFILLIFILNLFNYFDVLSGMTLKIIKMIIPVISMLIGSIYLGKNSIKKGYLEGLKLGVIISLVFFIFSFLGLDKSLSFSRIIYYAIVVISSMLGAMIGISQNNIE